MESLNIELPAPKTVFIDLNDDGCVKPAARMSEMNKEGVVESTIPTLETPKERSRDLEEVEQRFCLILPLQLGAFIMMVISGKYQSQTYPLILPTFSILLTLLVIVWFVHPLAQQIPDTASKKFVKQHYFATLILVVMCVIASIVHWKIGGSYIVGYVLGGATAVTQITLLLVVVLSSSAAQLETDSQRTFHRILKVMCCIALLASAASIGESILLAEESIPCFFSALTGLLYFAFTGSVAFLLNQTYRDNAALDELNLTDPSVIKSIIVDSQSNFFFAIHCAIYLIFIILPPLLNFFSVWPNETMDASDVNFQFMLWSYLTPLFLHIPIRAAFLVPMEARRFHIRAVPNSAMIWVETWLKTYCYRNIVHAQSVIPYYPAFWEHVYTGTGGRIVCCRIAVVVNLGDRTTMCIMTNRSKELVNAIQYAIATAKTVSEDGDTDKSPTTAYGIFLENNSQQV